MGVYGPGVGGLETATSDYPLRTTAPPVCDSSSCCRSGNFERLAVSWMHFLVMVLMSETFEAVGFPVASRHNRPKLTGRILCSLFFSALLGASLVQYFFLVGLKNTSPTFALAFSNMVPSVTFALALVFRQETLNIKSNIGRAKVLGTVICICGALVLTLYKGPALTQLNAQMQTQTSNSSTTAVTAKWAMGSVMLIISILIWSLWFIVQGKICQSYPCKYTSTTILSFFGVIQSALLSLISERNIPCGSFKEIPSFISTLFGYRGIGIVLRWSVVVSPAKRSSFHVEFHPFDSSLCCLFSFSFLHEQIYCGR
ncbi:WAT1-related protein [Raphanus sativus]|nr:WAT1-related protein [Raphanus sativus]